MKFITGHYRTAPAELLFAFRREINDTAAITKKSTGSLIFLPGI